MAERRARRRRHRKYVFADTKGFVTGAGVMEERFGVMRPKRAAFRMPGGRARRAQMQPRPALPVRAGDMPWPSFMAGLPQGGDGDAGWEDAGALQLTTGAESPRERATTLPTAAAAAGGAGSDVVVQPLAATVLSPGGGDAGVRGAAVQGGGLDVQDQVAELMVRRHGAFCAHTHARLEEEARNVPEQHAAPTPPARARALSARAPRTASVARAYAKGAVEPREVQRRLLARAEEFGSAADYERAREEEVLRLGGPRAMVG